MAAAENATHGGGIRRERKRTAVRSFRMPTTPLRCRFVLALGAALSLLACEDDGPPPSVDVNAISPDPLPPGTSQPGAPGVSVAPPPQPALDAGTSPPAPPPRPVVDAGRDAALSLPPGVDPFGFDAALSSPGQR
jgi:hypothetical protein